MSKFMTILIITEYHVKVTLVNIARSISAGLITYGSSSNIGSSSSDGSNGSTGSLNKSVKHKTKKIRGPNPVYSETMSFNVDRDNLEVT